MKTDKEKLLHNTYEKFLDLVLRDFPLDNIDEIAVKDVMGYGTTIDEKLFEIEGLRELVIRLREQSKGAELTIKTERIFQKLFSNDEAALIVDEILINMIIDGMTHVIPLRVSTVLEFIDDNWKVIHWHGSVAVESEDDTWHINEWKQKNEKLQRLVDEQTADLVNKNHELELEASLERVRAVAMSMHKSDDLLSICKVSFNEFKNLGFDNLRNTTIHILNDEKGFFMDYDYSDYLGGSINKINYDSHPIVENYLEQIKKADDAFAEVVIDGSQLDGWKDFRRKGGQPDDPKLDDIPALHYYLYSIGVGDIGISTFKPINESQITILKRFRNVFDLAYRRYTDITKAEEQAREAQIEAALERVRAVAMAMHKSEELSLIGKTIYSELKSLGFSSIRNTEVIINNDEKETVTSYHYSDYGQEEVIEIDYKSNKLVKQWAEDIRKAEDAFVPVSIPEGQIKSWDEYRISLGYKSDPNMASAKAVHYYSYSTGLGALSISTWNLLEEDQIKMLERFRNVFKLSYKRFKDIERAEAQAKEALIEAALERIRARAMGMHKSEEVGDVSDILFSELNQLDFEINGSSIVIIDEYKDKMELWRARSDVAVKPFESSSFKKSMKKLKKHMPDWYPIFFKALGKRENYLVDELSGKRRLNFINAIVEQYNYSGKEKNKLIENTPKTFSTHYIFFKLGYLGLLSKKKLSDENISIVRRFVEVFEFSYARFLDIRKAEAQAREAQIELAVERVRAKALTMHKSKEILGVVITLKNELMALNIPGVAAATIHLKEENGSVRMWDLSSVVEMEQGFQLTLDVKFRLEETDPAFFVRRVWEKEENYFVVKQDEHDLAVTVEWLRQYQPDMADEVLKFLQANEVKCLLHPTVRLTNGRLCADLLESVPAEMESILTKMGAAFDLAYKRFRDLQKAETQAREAEIELALERVRARTMAMQKSEELKEVIRVVYEQFVHLKINVDHAGFVVDYTPKGDWHFWIADEQEIPSKITHPYFESVWANQFNEAKEKGADFFATNLNFEEKNKFYKELLSYVPGLPEESKDFYLSCPGLAGLTALYDNVSLYIENFSGIPYSDEENKILMRFGKVFQQTYTRFLDLQKAEAQAREAQIEASLERVRSRAMAIHKSGELDEVIQIIFEELNKLGIDLMECSIATYDSNPKNLIFWSAGPFGSAKPSSVKLQYIDHPILIDLLKDLENGVKYRSGEFSGELLKSWWDRVFTETDFQYAPEEFIESWKNVTRVFYSQFAMKHGFLEFIGEAPLPDDKVKILKRFTNVVDLTYTRYDDVVKAEAQAREAQIEAALEKIRNRTLLMKDSSELNDAVAVFFQQFKALDLLPADARTYFSHVNNATDSVEVWMTHSDGSVMSGSHITPMTKTPSLKKFYEKWIKKREVINIRVYEGKSLKNYMKFLSTLPHVAKDKDYQKLFNSPPKQIVMTDAGFLQGFLGIMSFVQLKEETVELLARFAKVFEFTYTRFLDLQKAEAQAREAQIEAALERVRTNAMAMQSSDDLAKIVEIVFTELKKVGFQTLRCGIGIIESAESKTVDIWTTTLADDDLAIQISGDEVLEGHPLLDGIIENWKNQTEFSYILKGYDFEKYYKTIAKANLPIPQYSQTKKNIEDEKQYYYLVPCKAGGLYAFSINPFTDEVKKLMRRFIEVFQLAYTRYEDLQKAEAQAREAQIEAALERVRSKTMAMHNSHDVGITVTTLFDEVLKLGLDKSIRCGIGILEGKENMETWSATSYPNGEVDLKMGLLDMTIHPMLIGLKKAWENGESGYSYQYIGDDVIRYYKALNNEPEYPFYVELDTLPEKEYHNSFFFSEGILFAFTANPVSEEAANVLNRFANVFEQTYTRFLDLQKAEAQAREAQIEAALERVRSRSMAMHKSEELADLSLELVKQVQALGVATWFCAFNIYDDDPQGSLEWGSNGEGTFPRYRTPREGIFLRYYEAGQRGETFLINEIGANECPAHYDYLCTLPGVGEQLLKMKESGISFPASQIDHVAYFKYGYIIFITFDPAPEAHNIFKRFAKVFEQTYTRFLDLKNAEAQNKIIQAENDRKSKELEEARQLQLSMLPKELPDLPNLDIAVYMQTATEVGGDYYDFQVGLDGTLITVIGDATGHGMKAGTVVTITKSLFNSMAVNENILSTFNKISEVIKGMKFRQLAMCLIMMKIKGNRLSMSSAAMPPAFIYRKENKTVEEILLKAMPLGSMEKFPYKKAESKLNSGDRILLYSDGLPELANDSGEMYGYEKVKTQFQSVGEKEPEEIVTHLKNSASQWANGKAPDDDVTFVVIKLK